MADGRPQISPPSDCWCPPRYHRLDESRIMRLGTDSPSRPRECVDLSDPRDVARINDSYRFTDAMIPIWQRATHTSTETGTTAADASALKRRRHETLPLVVSHLAPGTCSSCLSPDSDVADRETMFRIRDTRGRVHCYDLRNAVHWPIIESQLRPEHLRPFAELLIQLSKSYPIIRKLLDARAEIRQPAAMATAPASSSSSASPRPPSRFSRPAWDAFVAAHRPTGRDATPARPPVQIPRPPAALATPVQVLRSPVPPAALPVPPAPVGAAVALPAPAFAPVPGGYPSPPPAVPLQPRRPNEPDPNYVPPDNLYVYLESIVLTLPSGAKVYYPLEYATLSKMKMVNPDGPTDDDGNLIDQSSYVDEKCQAEDPITQDAFDPTEPIVRVRFRSPPEEKKRPVSHWNLMCYGLEGLYTWLRTNNSLPQTYTYMDNEVSRELGLSVRQLQIITEQHRYWDKKPGAEMLQDRRQVIVGAVELDPGQSLRVYNLSTAIVNAPDHTTQRRLYLSHPTHDDLGDTRRSVNTMLLQLFRAPMFEGGEIMDSKKRERIGRALEEIQRGLATRSGPELTEWTMDRYNNYVRSHPEDREVLKASITRAFESQRPPLVSPWPGQPR